MKPAATAAHSGGIDLVAGPVGRGLLLFALPMLGSNILQSLNGSINSMWVGRFLGARALAATTSANLIMFLLFAGVFGLAMATSILVGQSAGRGEVAKIRRAVGTSGGLFLIAGVLITIASWLAAPWILRMLVTPHDVFPFALAYLRIITLVMPSVFIFVLLMMALRSTGDAMTPMWFMAGSAVLDAGLNPLLITGAGWFPELGIRGAALASLLASYISCAGLLVYIYRRDLVIRLRGIEWRYLRPERELLRFIVPKGLMMGLQSLIMTLSALALVGMVNRYGSTAAAAYGAVNQLWAYIQMPAMAIAASISTMAAQCIGAGKSVRLPLIASRGLVIALAMTGVMAVALVLVDHRVLQLFLPANGDAVELAQHIDRVGVCSLILFALTCVPGSIVRANGAVLVPLIILLVSVFPIRLGFIFVFESRFGIDAIWWSLVASMAASLGLSCAYYQWGGWRDAPLLSPSTPEPKLKNPDSDDVSTSVATPVSMAAADGACNA
ncbi:MAG TPA: MATE family efflux transporter [Solimonas sp.]